MNRTTRALILVLGVGLLLRFAVGCATPQQTQQRKVVVMLDTGTELVQISPHPCAGNWNFCKYNDLPKEELVIPAE